jgi:hypothetical protein
VPAPSHETTSLDERRAQLDADIRAELAWLRRREEENDARAIEEIEHRCRLGRLFNERLAITPKRQKGRFVRHMAAQEGFSPRSAYDNFYYDELHRLHFFDFATLAKMSVGQVREEAIRRRRTGHVDAGRLLDEVVGNTVTLAVHDIAKFSQTELRRRLQWLRRQVDFGSYVKWQADAIMRRDEVLSEDELARGLTHLLVDSGAYSAATLGVKIDVAKYSAFIRDNLSWIGPGNYFNLDDINEHLPDDAAAVSFARFEQMRREFGLDPVPVHHADEPREYLEKYVDAGCPRIGIGGVARTQSRKVRNRRFFEQCFELVAKCGRPVSLHALGVAVPEILLQFPWGSADGTTWILSAMRYFRGRRHGAGEQPQTDLSRLGSTSWVRSLTREEMIAGGLFLETHDAHRLEMEICEQRPEFRFYLVSRLGNPWAMPALRLVNHRSALFSYWGGLGTQPERLRRFIENPDAVLCHPRYDRITKLLQSAKERYEHRRVRLKQTGRSWHVVYR